MNFGLDSIDRANARARNAARLFAAALFVASLMLAFSARAAGTQLYDVTNLSLGGPVALVSGINASALTGRSPKEQPSAPATS